MNNSDASSKKNKQTKIIIASKTYSWKKLTFSARNNRQLNYQIDCIRLRFILFIKFN